jgi:hypothetical protein
VLHPPEPAQLAVGTAIIVIAMYGIWLWLTAPFRILRGSAGLLLALWALPKRLIILLLVVTFTYAALFTPATTADRRRPAAAEWYVADSNVFMDNPAGKGKICADHIEKRYLRNPNVNLVVHVSVVYREIGPFDRNGTQLKKAFEALGRRRMIAATQPPPNIDQLVRGNLGERDVLFLETALEWGLPLLTTNADGLRKQITNHLPAAERYGKDRHGRDKVRLIDPCENVPPGSP